MSSLVIAALPSEDDYVHKISSEEVPHMTLLLLGDATKVPNVIKIAEFLEHAVDIWERGPFMLDVDHRGTLGEDEADVLFFRNKGWAFSQVKQFRNWLLQNEPIRNAYDNATQFEGEWIPHLTLGYPATPAKEDTRDFPGIQWVHFNRIALWFGNYEGPEFRLEYDYDIDYPEMAMSKQAERGEEFLSHYGVKGMRWGIRKADSGGGGGSVGTKVATGAKKAAVGTGKLADNLLFEVATRSQTVRRGIIDKAQDNYVKNDLPRLKAKHQEGGKLKTRTLKPFSAEARAYRKDAKAAYVKQLEKSANTFTNIQGTRQFTLEERGKPNTSQYFWRVHTRKIQHADDDTLFAVVHPVFDADGYIIDIEPAEDTLEQGAMFVGDFLAHYGVKGMRWGVRNERSVSTSIQTDTGLARRRTKVSTKGGESQPAHTDAVVAAVQKQKLKKSGPAALSTQELRELSTRLQLEQQVAVLASSKGKKFVKRQIEQEGEQQLKRGVRRAATKVGTTALKVAV